MGWIHRFIRKRMTPMDMSTAAKMKQRFAIGYAIVAWNAFGYIIYMYYQGRGDWAKTHGIKTEEDDRVPQGVRIADMLGLEKATIRRYKGLQKVEELEYEAKAVAAPAN